MFNKDFYPTPSNLIREMLSKVKYLTSMSKILEPSAGKGDIIDYIFKNEYRAYRSREDNEKEFMKYDCIEIEPELQSVLTGKGYNVVHNDFLTYDTYTQYELILMNPPFSNGAKHLLKAISMQEKNGGQIVCLLNAETLKNPYSNDRKLLLRKLEELESEVKYISGGFTEAERKTNVETALINIVIERKDLEDDLFKNIKLEAEEEFESKFEDFTARTGLVSKDQQLEFLVKDYNTHIKLLQNAVRATNILHSFGNSIKLETNIYLKKTAGYHNDNSDYNEWVHDLRIKYWSSVMNVDTFKKYMTYKTYSKITNLIEKQSNLEFNLNNIYTVKQMLMSTFVKNLEESAVDVFEEATKYSQSEYSKNIWLYNGWKTNKGHKLNKKIVLPISFAGWYNNVDLSQHSSNKKQIEEIEKVLNYFDAFKEYTSVFQGATGDEAENDYIHIKAYKKGTTHITFKRLDLLDRFNMFVGKLKNWIPDPSELKTDADKKEYENLKKDIYEHYPKEYEPSGKLLLPF